jgi:hypothetical protein
MPRLDGWQTSSVSGTGATDVADAAVRVLEELVAGEDLVRVAHQDVSSRSSSGVSWTFGRAARLGRRDLPS